MKAGRLRSKVTFQRRATTKNAYGEPDNTWTDIAERRCSIEPLMGREYYAQSGEHSRLPTRIRIRYDDTVAALRPYDRAVDYSVSPAIVYGIESVQNPHNRDRELVLMCERNAAV
jgi:head-tail adaptor